MRGRGRSGLLGSGRSVWSLASISPRRPCRSSTSSCGRWFDLRPCWPATIELNGGKEWPAGSPAPRSSGSRAGVPRCRSKQLATNRRKDTAGAKREEGDPSGRGVGSEEEEKSEGGIGGREGVAWTWRAEGRRQNRTEEGFGEGEEERRGAAEKRLLACVRSFRFASASFFSLFQGRAPCTAHRPHRARADGVSFRFGLVLVSLPNHSCRCCCCFFFFMTGVALYYACMYRELKRKVHFSNPGRAGICTIIN